MIFNRGTSRNKPMLKVKKDDIVLVPRLPDWGKVAIVRAKEDWETGYRFEISDLGDYGDIFPAEFVKSFTRKNDNVSGNIRSTLRNPSIFWNILHLEDDVEILLA